MEAVCRNKLFALVDISCPVFHQHLHILSHDSLITRVKRVHFHQLHFTIAKFT
jgi:hypothetical protein